MVDKEAIKIKGNQDGLNIIINLLEFNSMDNLLNGLLKKLKPLKSFYSGNTVYITTYPIHLDDSKKNELKLPLKEEIDFIDVIFNDLVEDENLENKFKKEVSEEKTKKIFDGIEEGNTKFIKKTLRGGQVIDYPGNVVIIGDVHMGAEIFAEGNIIVLGELRGRAFAGVSGNKDSIVAALKLNPSLLSISKSLARPVDSKIEFPEVAMLKDGSIYVEPYIPIKYEYE